MVDTPISTLPMVSSVTPDDELYLFQSGEDCTATVSQIQASILGNISNSVATTEMPIDGILCIKDGIVANITPNAIEAGALPAIHTFQIDASNLELDCSTLGKDITELSIEIDENNLPVTTGYGIVYNLKQSNLKKVYIKQKETVNFLSAFTFMPNSPRYATLPYVAICLDDKSTNIDKTSQFRFNGFVQSAFLATKALDSFQDIKIPGYRGVYCDYIDIVNESGIKKVKTYYSIQGFATIIDNWTHIPQNLVIDLASWIFLFDRRGFGQYANDDFTLTLLSPTTKFQVATHAHKCQVWARQGYSKSVLANLNMDCSMLPTMDLGAVATLGYNVVSTDPRPYFVMVPVARGRCQIAFNPNIAFYDIITKLTQISWTMINIDYFEK